MHDPKQGLVRTGLSFFAAFGPIVRAVHGFLAVSALVRVGALVERHDDIGAEIFLDSDRLFGREAVAGAVDVTLERYPFIVDLVDVAQRENLEPARIGQNRVGPIHELVQSTQIGDDFITRPQVEMVRICQNQAGLHGFQLSRGDGLDRCLGSHRGKKRGFQGAMRRMKNPGPGLAILGDQFEFEVGIHNRARLYRKIDLHDFRLRTIELTRIPFEPDANSDIISSLSRSFQTSPRASRNVKMASAKKYRKRSRGRYSCRASPGGTQSAARVTCLNAYGVSSLRRTI